MVDLYCSMIAVVLERNCHLNVPHVVKELLRGLGACLTVLVMILFYAIVNMNTILLLGNVIMEQ